MTMKNPIPLAAIVTVLLYSSTKSDAQNSGAFVGLPNSSASTLRSDLTVQNPASEPSAELKLQLDIVSPASTDYFGFALSKPASGVPTLTQQFLSANGQWRWSVTNPGDSSERRAITLDAATNELKFYTLSGGTIGSGGEVPLKISPSGITIPSSSGYPGVSISNAGVTIGSGSGSVSLTSTGLSLAYGSNINVQGGSISVYGGITSYSGITSNTTVTGQKLVAGYGSLSGSSTLAVGYYNTGTGNYSAAIGVQNVVNGSYATVSGYNSAAAGNYSFAAGEGAKATSLAEVAIGRYNQLTGGTGGGNPTSWVSTDALFSVGNGTSDYARSNAFMIRKSGDASFSASLAAGPGTQATGSQVVVGKYNNTAANPAGYSHGAGVFVVGGGTASVRSNLVRVRDDGAVLVNRAGDISMGAFTGGEQP